MTTDGKFETNEDIKALLKAFDAYPQAQRDLLYRAYEFAKKAHDGQKRESGEPYIIHPCAIV